MMERSRARRCAPTSREIPGRHLPCEDCFDNDGIVDEPMPIKLAITVTGAARLHFDFTGTAAARAGR